MSVMNTLKGFFYVLFFFSFFIIILSDLEIIPNVRGFSVAEFLTEILYLFLSALMVLIVNPIRALVNFQLPDLAEIIDFFLLVIVFFGGEITEFIITIIQIPVGFFALILNYLGIPTQYDTGKIFGLMRIRLDITNFTMLFELYSSGKAPYYLIRFNVFISIFGVNNGSFFGFTNSPFYFWSNILIKVGASTLIDEFPVTSLSKVLDDIFSKHGEGNSFKTYFESLVSNL